MLRVHAIINALVHALLVALTILPFWLIVFGWVINVRFNGG